MQAMHASKVSNVICKAQKYVYFCCVKVYVHAVSVRWCHPADVTPLVSSDACSPGGRGIELARVGRSGLLGANACTGLGVRVRLEGQAPSTCVTLAMTSDLAGSMCPPGRGKAPSARPVHAPQPGRMHPSRPSVRQRD